MGLPEVNNKNQISLKSIEQNEIASKRIKCPYNGYNCTDRKHLLQTKQKRIENCILIGTIKKRMNNKHHIPVGLVLIGQNLPT